MPSTATPDLPHLQFLMTGDWRRSQLLHPHPHPPSPFLSPHQQQSGAVRPSYLILKDCSNEGPCAPNGHLGETLFHRPETGTRLHPCSVEVEVVVGGGWRKKGRSWPNICCSSTPFGLVCSGVCISMTRGQCQNVGTCVPDEPSPLIRRQQMRRGGGGGWRPCGIRAG